jgi:hypothetical protein
MRKWRASDGGEEEEAQQRLREKRGEDCTCAVCGGDGVCALRVCGCCWLHEEDGEDEDGEEHGETRTSIHRMYMHSWKEMVGIPTAARQTAGVGSSRLILDRCAKAIQPREIIHSPRHQGFFLFEAHHRPLVAGCEAARRRSA